MITESERERLKAMQDQVLEAMPHLELAGEPIPEEFLAQAAGTPMAMVDALFAIREGDAWRGMTDPTEIARTVLRQMGVGE
jgi:hypothetical protein